jgi:hypothetical protein
MTTLGFCLTILVLIVLVLAIIELAIRTCKELKDDND